MRKFIVFVVLVVLFFKYGVGTIFSEKFQQYGDRTKAPWTCWITLYIGHIYMLLDQPFMAKPFYDRIPPRCGGLDVASEARFQSARCFDQADRTAEAISSYEEFLVLHSTSPRVNDAQRALNRIKNARNF